MKPSSLADAWVAMANQNGKAEVCEIFPCDSNMVWATIAPVVLRYDTARREIIIEVQRAPCGSREVWEIPFDEKNLVFRLKVGNGLFTVRDREGEPIMQFVPCASRLDAEIIARQLAGSPQATMLAA